MSRFWAGVLGGHVVEDDDWHSIVDSEGEWRLGVQFAPDHVAPDWPSGTPGQQLHLDLWVDDIESACGSTTSSRPVGRRHRVGLWVDDIESAHAEVIALGARVLQEPDETNEPDRFRVYADPAGHPFCLCWVVGS